MHSTPDRAYFLLAVRFFTMTSAALIDRLHQGMETSFRDKAIAAAGRCADDAAQVTREAYDGADLLLRMNNLTMALDRLASTLEDLDSVLCRPAPAAFAVGPCNVRELAQDIREHFALSLPVLPRGASARATHPGIARSVVACS